MNHKNMSDSVIGKAMENEIIFSHKIELCESKYKILKSGIINFQICFDDKLYEIGHIVRIIEFRWADSRNIKELTGEYFEREIINILKKSMGLMRGYLVISLK